MDNQRKKPIPESSQPVDFSPLHSPDHNSGGNPISSQAASHGADSPAESSISSGDSSLSHGFSPREEKTYFSPPGNAPGSPSAPVTVVNRLVRDEPVPETITKTDSEVTGVRLADIGEEGGGGVGRKSRPSISAVNKAKRETMAKKAALGFRILGSLFCLISFSVMAADRYRGWALDSFDRYKEFRYCMSVNVLGFVYAGAQATRLALAHHSASGNYSVRKHHWYYFDFAFDQVLTYLLISASSSAATRVEDWQANWGEDKFPEMATASLSLSFLAFAAFAFGSLISGYLLCTNASL